MIRKSIYALAAVATVAAVSFASSSPAEARRWHRWGGVGIVVGAPFVASCVQYQWVETRRGWRYMAVNVC